MIRQGSSNPWLYADISDDQPYPNMHAYASAGHIVIARKASEGAGLVQNGYAADVEAAHSAGLKVIHYHYADLAGLVTFSAEAEHFWHTVRMHFAAGDRLMLDVEQVGHVGWGMLPAWVVGFSRAVKMLAKEDVLGYTYLSMMRQAAPTFDVLGHEWVIAAWGGEVPPLGGQRVRWAHQRSTPGVGPLPWTFAGIGAADCNLLTKRAFRQLTVRR